MPALSWAKACGWEPGIGTELAGGWPRGQVWATKPCCLTVMAVLPARPRTVHLQEALRLEVAGPPGPGHLPWARHQ